MLDFIVLGQIPGTHIQITFAWFLLAILVGLLWADLKMHSQLMVKKQGERTKKTTRARA